MRPSLRPRETPRAFAAPPLLRVALETRASPAGGVLDPPFRWDDVLDGLPPRPQERDPPAYCVRGPEVLAGTWRVETALVVRAQGRLVEAEDRLCVTRRALAGAIQTERAVVGARLEEAKRRGVPAGLLDPARAATKGLAALPDRLGQAARRARHALATREGRRMLWAGLRDPHRLHPEQKAVALFTGTCALLGLLLLAHLAVTLVAPRFAVPWRSGVLLFLYGYVSSVGIPLPWEPALLAGAVIVGPVVAIAVALLAKLVAGYMVFFVGDEVNEKLERRAARSPLFAKGLRLAEAFARRFGVFAMALFIFTPGLPDAVALYVFGSLGMPVRRYLAGILVGAAALDLVVVYGGLRVLGIG